MPRHISMAPGAALIALCAASPAPAAADEAVVVVTATRQAQRASELLADVTVVDRDAVERLGQGTVADLLLRQPGIQGATLGGAGTQTEIFVRGARSEQTKILVDGVPFNSMDLRGSPMRFLPLDNVERIEILRGPASAVHGSDAIGGVIQIFTRPPEAGFHGDAYAGTGAYGTEKLSGSISVGDQNWSARVFAGDHRTDGFSSVRNARNRDADADAYRNRSGGGSLSFRPAPGHEIGFSGISNRGIVHYDGTTGAGTFDNRIGFKNEVWSLYTRDRLADGWGSTLRWGGNIDEQNSYTSAGLSALRTSNTSLSWQNDLRLPIGTGLVVVETQRHGAGPASRFTRDTAKLDAVQLGWNGRQADHRWQLGVRRDRHSQFGTDNNGTAGYGYQLDAHWRAHAGVGTSFRAPTLYQLYASKPGELVANPNLQPERGRNVELGVVREQGAESLSFVAYRNRVRNMIDYDTPSLSYRNISIANLRGWTLKYQAIVADWTLSGSLDFLDATDRGTGLRLKQRARRKATLTADTRWREWTLGAEWQAVGRRFNRDNETQPMGGYSLVNLTAAWTLGRGLTLELRGDNVTNKRYVNAMTSSGLYAYATPGANAFVGLRYTH